MADEGDEQKPNVGAGPEHLNLQVKSQVAAHAASSPVQDDCFPLAEQQTCITICRVLRLGYVSAQHLP